MVSTANKQEQARLWLLLSLLLLATAISPVFAAPGDALTKQISSTDPANSSQNQPDFAYIQNELARAAKMHKKAIDSWQTDSPSVRLEKFAREADVLNHLPRNVRLAFAYCRLAETYEDQLQDLKQAYFYYESALGIFDRELGEDAGESIKVLERMAAIAEHDKDDARTEHLYKRALVCAEAGFGDDVRQARVLEELAQFYCSKKRWHDAEPLFQKAVAIYDKDAEASTLASSTARDKLAEVYITEDRPQSAEHLFKTAITGYSKFAGPKALVIAGLWDRLGKLHLEQGHLNQAEKDLEKAISIKEASLGTDSEYLLVSLDLYEAVLVKFGKGDAAREVAARARQIRTQTH